MNITAFFSHRLLAAPEQETEGMPLQVGSPTSNLHCLRYSGFQAEGAGGKKQSLSETLENTLDNSELS